MTFNLNGFSAATKAFHELYGVPVSQPYEIKIGNMEFVNIRDQLMLLVVSLIWNRHSNHALLQITLPDI